MITQKFGLRHLVGDHISLCTTWPNRECEPSVSAPWTSTWVMDLSVGREWFVRFEGAVCRESGAAQAAEPTWPSLVFAYGDAVVWEKKMHVKCLFLHISRPDCQVPIRSIDLGLGPLFSLGGLTCSWLSQLRRDEVSYRNDAGHHPADVSEGQLGSVVHRLMQAKMTSGHRH